MKIEDELTIIRRRAAFGVDYCMRKGWSIDPADLSVSQILEIRGQEGWKNPLKSSNDITIRVEPA